MQRGLFVSATDTGMGKTFIGCAIARSLLQAGQPVRVVKPAESGCLTAANGERLPADAQALREAAGNRQPLAEVCPHRLEAALAPPEAARRENRNLPVSDLVDACQTVLAAGDYTLVEGAGGIYSPIADDALNLHLAITLDLPILLVAADRLGTQSVTLTAAESILRHGARLAGIVLNQRPEDRGGEDQPNNVEALRHWLPRLLGRDTPVIRAGHDGFEDSDIWDEQVEVLASTR
ncbi:MAG: dethiobiotin synthase [Halothiobacillaceae bacterium]